MPTIRVQLPTEYVTGLRSSMVGLSQFRVADRPDGAFDVEPAEGAGAVRRYFDVHQVARARTNLDDDATWAFLGVHPPASPKPSFDLPGSAMKALSDLAEQPGLAAYLQLLGSEVAMTEVEDLPALLRRELPRLFDWYPNGSLWYVSVDRVLLTRLTFMRIALQLELTPDTEFGGARGGTYFDVHQLTGGTSFADVIMPILLTFAPVVSGFTMNAAPHAFVFQFGQFDDDHDLRTHGAGPLARSYFPAVNVHHFSPGIKMPMDKLPTADIESLLGWWASRLNILYSHAADPTRFATDSGDHDVASQAAWFFTFERMVADYAGLSASVDSPGLLRMQVAFDTLDKAASLLVGSHGSETAAFLQLLNRDHTLPRLDQAFQQMPLQLRSRFGQWAGNAFERLYADVAAGTMPSRITSSGVLVGHNHSLDLRELSWGEYVSRLIREARNASHGLQRILTEEPRVKPNYAKFGPPRQLLLATNAGEVPASLYEVTRALTFALLADAPALCARTW